MKKVTTNKRNNGEKIEVQYKEAAESVSGLSTGIGVLMFIGAAICVVTTVGQMVDKCSREDIFSCIVSFYSMGLLGLVSMFIGKAFGSMKGQDSPFTVQAVGHFKKAASLLLFGGAGGMLMFVLFGLNSGNMNPGSAFITDHSSFLIMIMVGAVVKAISQIFEYGGKLGTRSDEAV